MSVNNVDDLSAALESTRVSPSGVSFAGQSLKLDTEDDAKKITDAIDKCDNLQFLNLEGNTLGVDASKVIAKSLEKHPEFKRALWKDMFTGRMKTEIPKALEFLGAGLVTAGARLTELDLSDNAFGPIGVEGLAALLRSQSCYALEELRLNNNGLGITGGKLLASALTNCYNCSKKDGKPLALKVFIAGRNRLENDGAVALAAVFKMIGTLEEVAMPQNGIYHVGISALSDAFTHNKNLQIINLNDNTIGPKGAAAIAKALPNLQNLKEVNFGDCLLKTNGALCLAEALKNGHSTLEELILGHNEIRLEGGLALAKALNGKPKLKNVVLNGNQFGGDGRSEMKRVLKEIGKLNILGSLSEDESEDSNEEEEETESCEEENSDAEAENLVANKSIQDFLSVPTPENYLGLGDNRNDIIHKAAKRNGEDISLDSFLPILMKVSSLSVNSKDSITKPITECSEVLYKELFLWAQKSNNLPLVSNNILVNVGLLKGEDKKFKPSWNVDGCVKVLKKVIEESFVPETTKDTIKFFIQRQVKT